MKIAFLSIVFFAGTVTLAFGQTTSTVSAASPKLLVSEYCVGCHNDRLKTGGLVLSGLMARPYQDARIWEQVLLKVRAGMMPPAGARRPDAATIKAFVSALETELDQAAALKPNPGRPSLHRLNRTEYANSIRDLLALDVDVESLLPADDMSNGFDNMAEVLNISPTLMEGYIRAAGKISRAALGDLGMSPLVETYHVPIRFSQLNHVEGTPFGTRGGIAVRHNFPADGEYVFKMTFYYASAGQFVGNQQKDQQIEVAVNGERAALFDINPRMTVTDDLRTARIKVKAGPQTISAAFIKNAYGPVEDVIMPFQYALVNTANSVPGLSGLPHLRDLGILGPYNVTAVGDTPSRRKIFVCRPVASGDEVSCAKKIISALARQAFRRPVTAAELNGLLKLYHDGRSKGDFDSGIRTAVQAIIADPEFAFRFEQTPANVPAGANYRISDLELASRLSYFLWSSAPDDRLLGLAAQGKLKDPVVLDQEVRRLIADPRSEALATNFAGQWLYLRNLRDFIPEVFQFPDVDVNLLDSMRRETELFFDSILREDRNVVDMLTADYTFVDERLAKHYRIPNIAGTRFRRVSIAEEARKGLLGQGSILTVTSFPTRTAPTLRGQWVLDNLLGTPPPPPPPNVPPLKENEGSVKRLSVRERLQEHRANPACAACHRMMDPIGLALENFDAVGAWRIRDGESSVDARGQLFDGTNMEGPVGLRQALVSHSDAFLRTFTEKLLTYALGRGIEYYDMPAVRLIVREATRNNNRFSSFILGIVKSIPFQMRRSEWTEPVSDVAAVKRSGGG